jgi:hypothetical protein
LIAPAGRAFAHCDTMDGPVVKDARSALESGDVTPVLKWIQAEAEPEVRAAFERTLRVRVAGGETLELADMYFFETLVRVHRAGEGAPYTGLKPAGSPVDPAVLAADRALETGSPDELVKLLTGQAADGLRERFREASEARAHATHNLDAGRRFVAAYVMFTHYAEGIGKAAVAAGGHEGHAAPAGSRSDSEPSGEHRHP